MSASFDKQAIIKEYALTEGDTGSPEVQVALLTYRINHLTEHLKTHKGDHLREETSLTTLQQLISSVTEHLSLSSASESNLSTDYVRESGSLRDRFFNAY